MRTIILWLLLCGCCVLHAQIPAWVNNTPKAGNSTYKFVEIISYGTDYQSAQVEAKKKLAQNEQLIRSVEIAVDTRRDRKIDQSLRNSQMEESIKDITYIDVNIKGKVFKLQAVIVDEYSKSDGKTHELHTLFQVATTEDPVFEKTYLTTRYGAAPVAMSIIPGLGQWYKGSKTKGICMLGAEAVAVASVIVCENQRASYIKKSKEQPKFAKEYGGKASNWETGRNISIGVAAGIWIYNIIDAAVAKGARRVVVQRPYGRELSVAPFALPDAAGISFAYKF